MSFPDTFSSVSVVSRVNCLHFGVLQPQQWKRGRDNLRLCILYLYSFLGILRLFAWKIESVDFLLLFVACLYYPLAMISRSRSIQTALSINGASSIQGSARVDSSLGDWGLDMLGMRNWPSALLTIFATCFTITKGVG